MSWHYIAATVSISGWLVGGGEASVYYATSCFVSIL